jgi:hypothetical protein
VEVKNGADIALTVVEVGKGNRDYTKRMTSRIETVETEIMQMSAEELATFREWFAEFEADEWDRQFAAHVKAGKLDHLAEKARRDFETGLLTEL